MKNGKKLFWNNFASIVINFIIYIAVGYWIKRSLDYEITILDMKTGNEFDRYYTNIILLGIVLQAVYMIWFFLARKNTRIRHWIEKHVGGSLIILAAVGVIIVALFFILTGKVYRGNDYYEWPWRLLAYLGAYLSGILICCPYNLSAVMVYGYHNRNIKIALKLFWCIMALTLEFFLLEGVKL